MKNKERDNQTSIITLCAFERQNSAVEQKLNPLPVKIYLILYHGKVKTPLERKLIFSDGNDLIVSVFYTNYLKY